MLTFRQYVTGSVCATLVLAAAFVAVNVSVDIYGIFRSTKDRSVKCYLVERTAKYLFAQRYIPENFDGLLVGSSVSDNISTKYIQGPRVYNASLNGANITEVALVMDEAMQRKKFRVIIFCLTDYLVKDHGRKTSYQYPREYWEALGSLQLFETYLVWGLVKLGFWPDYYDENGLYRFELVKSPKTSTELIRENVAGWESESSDAAEPRDPAAWEELGQLVKRARANAEQVLVYYPPMPEAIRRLRQHDFKKFILRTSALFDGPAVIRDFNEPQYNSFRSCDANFRDCNHLSELGAVWLARELDKFVNAPLLERPSR